MIQAITLDHIKMLKYAMRLKNRYLTLSRHFSSKSIGICAARCKHAI